MISRFLVTILLSTLALSAQTTVPATDDPKAAIYPVPIQFYKELQQFLNLTDQQLDSLRTIQSQRDQAIQAIWKQVSDKQTELYQLLQSGSTDYVRLGQLLVESNNLQKQANNPVEPYRSQALAVITPAQKPKLQILVDGLKLITPGYQAVALNLADMPFGPPIGILATPAAGGTVPPVAPLTAR